jgi:mutator family transposase
MAGRYAATYPAAMKCLLADRGGLTAYLRFPAEHHPRVRHSNFIERTFGETRRRTKVIGRLPGETSCLTLVWAVLDRASRGWRGLTMTSDGLRLLQDLRRSNRPASSGHAPSPRPGTTSVPTTSVPPPNVALNRNRARPFYSTRARQAGATAPEQSSAGSTSHHPQTVTNPRSFGATTALCPPVVRASSQSYTDFSSNLRS